MPDDLDIPEIDADPRLRLLSDALRAGPGSPEWAAAVTEAQSVGVPPGIDEYAVLLAARERLAEGRAYRSVRAGPGFGRRLMSRVDADVAARSKSPLSAGLFAYVGVGLVVAVVGLLSALILRSISGEGTGQAELAQAYFSRSFATATLTGPLPPGFQSIGSLSLNAANGLALDADRKVPATDGYAGGGLVTAQGRPGRGTAGGAGDVPLRSPGAGVRAAAVHLRRAGFHARQGDGPARVGLAGAGRPGPGGRRRRQREGPAIEDPRRRRDRREAGRRPRRRRGRPSANKQVLWTGNSGLADKPRYAGVRILYRADGRRDAVTVTNLKVAQK